MRSSRAAAAVVAALACLPGGAAAASDATPSRLLVTAREYSLSLSRPKLRPGPSIVQLYNFGEDPHDLRIRKRGSDRVFEIGDVEPGETGSIGLKLRSSSRYRLWCAIPTHADLGMVATLRTKKKRPPRHRRSVEQRLQLGR
ncbi:MAG: hypothetical protein KDB46_07640 [Solirubrobacterales bacterium]|nr:hypothetical protein [Solirubrobacterales bacterium]